MKLMADWALFKRSCVTLTSTQKLMALIYDVHEGQTTVTTFSIREIFLKGSWCGSIGMRAKVQVQMELIY